MEIVVANRQRTKRIDTRLLKALARWCAAEMSAEEIELGIHLVGANEMADVHQRFMNIEGSTDAITFDHGSVPPKKVHGEIFVCVDDALEQAREFKTKWQEEIARYAIHGILHLLGFDDLNPAARRIMKREENRLVALARKEFKLSQLERK